MKKPQFARTKYFANFCSLQNDDVKRRNVEEDFIFFIFNKKNEREWRDVFSANINARIEF